MNKLNWEKLTLLAGVCIHLRSASPKCFNSVERYSHSFLQTLHHVMPLYAIKQYKDTIKSVKASEYINSLSMCCPFAEFLVRLYFHNLPLSQSCLSHQLWSLSKVQKNQIVTTENRERGRCSAWDSYSFIHPSRLSFYPCQTILALWPHSSTISAEQLVSIRTPF